MSRLLIVQTIVAMGEMGKTCEVLYSEAAVYPPTREEYTAARVSGARSPAFISSGVFEVVSSPELSSVAMLGSPIRLIAFLSFDSSQLRNLVQEIQPTHNDVVCGLPPHADMAWRRDALIETNEATVKMLRRAERHEACTFDYRWALRLILAVYGNHSVFDRIVIAPTGSKMQALAVGIIRSLLGACAAEAQRTGQDCGRAGGGLRDSRSERLGIRVADGPRGPCGREWGSRRPAEAPEPAAAGQ